jgi:hypothetical protein
MTDLDGLRRMLEDAVAGATADELPGLAGVVAGIQARIALRLSTPAPAAPVTERLLDAATLAARLSLPVSWVREGARRGWIPSVRVGAYRRFDAPEVFAALRAGQATDPSRRGRGRPRLSEVGHRIVNPARQKKARKNGSLEAAATALLPQGTADDADRRRHGVQNLAARKWAGDSE